MDDKRAAITFWELLGMMLKSAKRFCDGIML